MKLTALVFLLALFVVFGTGSPFSGDVAAQSTATTFVIRIENVAEADALTANGENAPVLLSPGVWVTHTQNRPLFASGFPDFGEGLEALAEDGNPVPLMLSIEDQSGIVDGGAFNTPVGGSAPGPIGSGQAYEFTLTATAGERLSLATMFVQSNDLFYAPSEIGMALFDLNGGPIEADLTPLLRLWDAGTEVNQRPGAGADQAPRQPWPNVGRSEGGVVQQVDDGFSYPGVSEVLRLTVRPLSNGGAANACANDVESARYAVTFDATWSASSHPTNFPDNPHFSGLIGATHNSGVTFWQQGVLASAGIKNMAEQGSKNPFNSEIQTAIAFADAEHLLSGGEINPSPGTQSLTFDISADFPLVTLVAKIAPSPDWFVGVSSMSLCENGQWANARTVELLPWDAGTDSGTSFESRNSPTDPPKPISSITGFPFQAANGRVPPLGTFRFVRTDQGAN